MIDLMLSFDTTSSMHAVLESARRELGDTLQGLFADCGGSADLRVGLILHGDYGDLYETRIAQPTDSVDQLAEFVAEAPNTCGLDYPECYELVLHQAVTRVNWRQQRGSSSNSRFLIMLGDAVPHEPNSKRNKYQLDWRKEARKLAAIGVTVYCVDCGGVGTGFYAFARELCAICRGGATVPYRGCAAAGLGRLLKRLVLRGGSGDACRLALDRQYRNYHNNSQKAETAPMLIVADTLQALVPAAGNNNKFTPTAAAARRSGVGSRCGRVAPAGMKTAARCLGRMIMYIGLVYIMYTMWAAACL